MTLEDYMDAINVGLVVRRYANQSNRWMAEFEDCEIMEDGCLRSGYGDGHSASEAISAYIDNIRGRRIVINATGGVRRREFDVPRSIES